MITNRKQVRLQDSLLLKEVERILELSPDLFIGDYNMPCNRLAGILGNWFTLDLLLGDYFVLFFFFYKSPRRSGDPEFHEPIPGFKTAMTINEEEARMLIQHPTIWCCYDQHSSTGFFFMGTVIC